MTRSRYFGWCSLAVALLLPVAWGCGDAGPGTGSENELQSGAGHREDEGRDDEHGGETVLRLDTAAVARLGLEIEEAGSGDLAVTVDLPGEVRVNGDRMAHVAPRVGGVVRAVFVTLGDAVRTGQLLAVLESRELADAKADYLAAAERLGLAEATQRREERLWRQKVSAEQDYLDATTALAEARIALRAAEQKLHVLGFAESDLRQLDDQSDTEYARYRITAPFDGEVIDRHITVGETIAAETSVLAVADLSSVWIDLEVYQKDLALVRAGQRTLVQPAGDGAGEEAVLEFVQPLLGEATRTALARITMPNPERSWKPGMFVTGSVIVDAAEVALRVPRTALIRMDDGDDVIFVVTDEGFEAREVEVGRRTPDAAEIVTGLEPGERYVSAGGFSLKAELGKAAFGDGHGH